MTVTLFPFGVESTFNLVRRYWYYLPRKDSARNIDVTQDKNTNYEGWNFNSGNYLFTTDTKQIHVSKFYCPSV